MTIEAINAVPKETLTKYSPASCKVSRLTQKRTIMGKPIQNNTH